MRPVLGTASTDVGDSYILDFEDWIAVDRSDVEALWDLRPRWGLWFLSEDCGPSWFEGKRPYMVTGEDGLQI